MRARWLFAPMTVLASLAIALLAGEAVVRAIDGYSLRDLELVRPPVVELSCDAPPTPRVLAYVADLPVASGVRRAWFEEDPPARARPAPSAELETMAEKVKDHPRELQRDVLKLWNSTFVQERVCTERESFFYRMRRAAGGALAYRSVNGEPHPRYRFYPDVSVPDGLVTNRFGWRGPQIDVVKPPNTIRIAFLGASTTVSSHDYPFSYPEYIGHWLDLWAETHAPGIRFEVLNTGREMLSSTDIAAVTRLELLPARPDIAVYYEGSNQFAPQHSIEVTEDLKPGITPVLDRPAEGLERFSGLARRFRIATSRLDRHRLQEPPKPAYRPLWPAVLNDPAPDLRRDDLPLDLPVILADLEDIRGRLESIGAELFLSSFVWLVDEGMTLDPVRDRNIFLYLNRRFWPCRYADLRRLADFQNRALEAFAARRDVPFLDVAAAMPRDPALFSDAIHMRPDGLRLRAWITLQLLIPLIEERIASGDLPRTDGRRPDVTLPEIEILRTDLECGGELKPIAARELTGPDPAANVEGG